MPSRSFPRLRNGRESSGLCERRLRRFKGHDPSAFRPPCLPKKGDREGIGGGDSEEISRDGRSYGLSDNYRGKFPLLAEAWVQKNKGFLGRELVISS